MCKGVISDNTEFQFERYFYARKMNKNDNGIQQ